MAISRVILALFFATAGANHFISPALYRGIMPPYLPAPDALVAISGLAEIILGCAVLVPRVRVRRWTGWGLIGLLCAVFPANVHMALHGFRDLPAWLLWVRLPFQGVFIAWVYASCLTEADRPGG